MSIQQLVTPVRTGTETTPGQLGADVILNTAKTKELVTASNAQESAVADLQTKALRDKGFYATSTALIAANPTGVAGDKAIVGATDTLWTWDVEGAAWKNTGASAGGITVDSAPTNGSANAVSSDGVYDALAGVSQQVDALTQGLTTTGLDIVPNSATRQAVALQNNLAGGGANTPRFVYLKSSVFIDDTSSQLQATRDYGPYFSLGNGRFASFAVDSLAPCNLVGTGDSWIDNFGLNPDQAFAPAVAGFYGMSYTKKGYSGIKIVDLTIPNTYEQDHPVNLYLVGTNDVRAYGLACARQYNAVLQFHAVWYLTKLNFAYDAAISAGNSAWTNCRVGNVDNRGAQSTTTGGSPLVFTARGPVVYVGMAHCQVSNNTYSITIDGVAQGTYSSQLETYTGYPDKLQVGHAHRFDVGPGHHTVSIQPVAGTDPAVVVYVNSSASAFSNLSTSSAIYARFVCLAVPQVADVTTPAPAVVVSKELIRSFNRIQAHMVTQLALDGLNIQQVDTNRRLDGQDPNQMQSDGLHPSVGGAKGLHQTVNEELAPSVTARERHLLNSLGRNRYTTAERDLMEWSEGDEIYNLTDHAKQFWNGSAWKTFSAS